MIFGLARLAVVLFIVQTVLFFLLRIYSRSLRREALEKQWDRGGIAEDRAVFIRRGMEDHEKGLFLRLVWLVYVIPGALIAVAVYVLNFTQW